MCRVAIIGNVGGGKSTLCRGLAQSKRLPLTTVDKLQWRPGWTLTPREALDSALDAIQEKDLWIIDGWGSWRSIELRFERADTIIFVDHAVWVHFWFAAKRQLKAFIAPDRVDTPEGCDLSKVTREIFEMIWRIHTQMRDRLLSLIDAHRGNKAIYHIRSPRELRRFVRELC